MNVFKLAKKFQTKLAALRFSSPEDIKKVLENNNLWYLQSYITSCIIKANVDDDRFIETSIHIDKKLNVSFVVSIEIPNHGYGIMVPDPDSNQKAFMIGQMLTLNFSKIMSDILRNNSIMIDQLIKLDWFDYQVNNATVIPIN